MFKEFFKFEIRQRIKQPMPYIFFTLFFAMAYTATTGNNIALMGFGRLGNVHKNSPYTITAIVAVISYLAMLVTTAFMAGSALRDHKYKFFEIIGTSPVDKFGYLMGRFAGSIVIIWMLYPAIVAGNIVGTLISDPDKMGTFMPAPYITNFFIFFLPNVFFAGALFYAVAVATRSQVLAFVANIGMIFAYSVAVLAGRDLETEAWAVLIDPFGIKTATLVTKYWTIADKNSLVLSLTGGLLLNRVVWAAVGSTILAFVCYRFSFSARKIKHQKGAETPSGLAHDFFSFVELKLPAVSISHGIGAQLLQFWSQLKIDFRVIVRTPAFVMIAIFLTLNLGPSATFFSAEWFGTPSTPVTYKMMAVIRGTYSFMFYPIIIYFAGFLAWRERENRFSELNDAAPYPTWVIFVAKTSALVLMIFALCIISLICVVFAQMFNGYFNFEFGLYFKDLFLIEFSHFAMMCVLSMFIQSVFNHRYLAYLCNIAFLLATWYVLDIFDLEHNLYRFAEVPKTIYSDLNGFGPYAMSVVFFKIYWALASGLLCLAGIMFWNRGKVDTLAGRLRQIKQAFRGKLRASFLLGLPVFVLLAGFIFYNTNILNAYVTKDDRNALAARYEKKYKRFENVPQPKIVDVKLNVEFFPEDRRVDIAGTYWLQNKTERTIDSLHISSDPAWDLAKLNTPDAELIFEDIEVGYHIFKLRNPLSQGDSTLMEFAISYDATGFENQVSQPRIVRNGTFFSSEVLPQIGYFAERELDEKLARQEQGLTPKQPLPPVTDMRARMHPYQFYGADWLNFEATLVTSSEQIAVAPGSLVKEWLEDGRRHFHYELEHKILNSFAFMSARYEVARDRWQDVDIEVYYHKSHNQNVDRMVSSIKNSLAYYTENFGPYAHKQARIVEFPRYVTFAQAFPGTMPYSESVGFISNVEDEDAIDFVNYVVAHEIGHQWWAYQVISGFVQGGDFLSESLSQYAALMVMEKTHGKDMMHKFLRYEMDRYLQGRGRATTPERPLLYTENQTNVHYNKGSVVMYALREYIGEERLNGALRRLIQDFAYQEPPYPTSAIFLDYIRAVTPDSLHYMLEDMFETITLYSNRMIDASYRKTNDGRFALYLTVESRKYRADSLGVETEIPVNDWVDIGVYARDKNGKENLVLLVRRKIHKAEMEFEIILDQEPTRAGIDPNYLLIDRFPNDNIKKAFSLDEDVAQTL